MMTTFDFMLASMIVGNGGSAETVTRVQRIRATVAWVRAACERDGLPDWLIELVMQRIEHDLLADDCPLVASDAEASEPMPLLRLDALYWRNDVGK